jgi:hypothetical protein
MLTQHLKKRAETLFKLFLPSITVAISWWINFNRELISAYKAKRWVMQDYLPMN